MKNIFEIGEVALSFTGKYVLIEAINIGIYRNPENRYEEIEFYLYGCQVGCKIKNKIPLICTYWEFELKKLRDEINGTCGFSKSS